MSDGSREQPKTTAGLDLGDKYGSLCLLDTRSGGVVEEGRLRTTPEALGGASAPKSSSRSPSSSELTPLG